MSFLENAIVIEPKRGMNTKSTDGLFFTTSKTKVGYTYLRFYIGVDLAKKIKLNESSRLTFAYDKEDHNIWYLYGSDKGFQVAKTKNGKSYMSAIKFPFDFVKKSMQEIPNNEIEIQSDKRLLTLFVDKIFPNQTLILKNSI